MNFHVKCGNEWVKGCLKVILEPGRAVVRVFQGSNVQCLWCVIY